MRSDLESSYRYCQETARRSQSNFYWCFRLLPFDKRRSMHALYAFARHTDDLGDSDEPSEARRQAMADWRHCLCDAFSGHCCHPIMPALVDTVNKHAIPPQYLFDILDGVCMDLKATGFETFSDLHQYCYRVASVVGLACLHIWGFSGQDAIALAIDRGVAFQLTNIVRDVREDAYQDRVYFPREDLQRFNCSPDDFRTNAPNDQVQALIRFEVERAESFYQRSKHLSDSLHHDGRRILRLMTATYWHLLQSIKQCDGDVFSKRVSLGIPARLRIVNSALLPWGSVRRRAF